MTAAPLECFEVFHVDFLGFFLISGGTEIRMNSLETSKMKEYTSTAARLFFTQERLSDSRRA